MSDQITIEEIRIWRRDILRDGAKPIDLISMADLSISQSETIKAQEKEIESLKKYFFMHENCRLGTGLCKRARPDGNHRLRTTLPKLWVPLQRQG